MIKKLNSLSKAIVNPKSFSDRNFCLILGAVCLLVLAVRIFALLSLKHTVYFDYLLYDEKVYHKWAMKIAGGTFSSNTVYDFAPLPAYVMAAVYNTFSPNPMYIRFLNIIFGTMTCFFIYLFSKELFGRKIGLISCLVAGLYKPFIFFSIVLQKTALSLLLFSLATYLFLSVLNKTSAIKIFFIGIAIGLMVNVRSNIIVVIPIIGLIILWDTYKRRYGLKLLGLNAAVYITGLIVALSPFAIRNYMVSGEFSATPLGGFNLYIGNNLVNKQPYYRPLPFASSVPSDQATHFIIEASKREKRKLSPGEASDFWKKEVIKAAKNQPGAFSRKIIEKLLVLFNRHEAADNHHIGFVSRFAGFFRLPFFSIWIIFPLGLSGMMLSIPGDRKAKALGLIALIYSLTLVVFFTNVRLRLPILVIVIPFAVAGLVKLNAYIRSRQFKKVGIWAGVTAFFFILAFLPVRGTDDMTAYYNTHALALNSRGMINEAIKYWQQSSEMQKPYSAYANIWLTSVYYKKGMGKKSVEYLQNVPDTSFAASEKYELLGNILMHQRQEKAAISAFEKSLAINSGQIRTRGKLIKLYEKLEPQKAIKARKELAYIRSFF